LLPLSGVAIAVAGWMIFGRVLELMAERGRPATVYSSINRAGGDARYRQASEEYNQRGY
jgi:uncharacterized phosphosugar-binding protein